MKTKNMNLLCGLALFVATICLTSAQTVDNVNQTDGATILIVRRPTNPQGNSPRNLITTPFSAELLEFGLFLSADADCGDVDVTLSSLEGDYFNTTFDTADGAILLPVNGNTGDNYTITIVTNDGIIYEGNFYL